MTAKYCFREKMLAKTKDLYLCYYRGQLVLKDLSFNTIKKVRIHKWYESFVLVERLLRKEPRVALVLDDKNIMFSSSGYIYTINVDTLEINVMHKFDKGMNNPLAFCTRRDKSGKIVDVVYGEYIWNDDHGCVSIYRFDMHEWKLVHSFKEQTIQHIHNVIYDEARQRYLILTGDKDEESAIWEADVYFTSVTKVVGGKQTYRSCVCLPTNNGLYYLTDTPLESNYLYYLDNKNELTCLSQVDGPCIYGLAKDGVMYFATSVEGDPNVGRIRYRLFNKLGKGVKDRYVHVCSFKPEGQIEEIIKFRKDYLPMWLFQFGNAQFVDADDGIYITTQSVFKNGTYKIISEAQDE